MFASDLSRDRLFISFWRRDAFLPSTYLFGSSGQHQQAQWRVYKRLFTLPCIAPVHYCPERESGLSATMYPPVYLGWETGSDRPL